jgi:very-short-patch-repair endonuclease
MISWAAVVAAVTTLWTRRRLCTTPDAARPALARSAGVSGRPSPPLRRRDALAVGHTDANLRSRAWRRTFHGVYAPAGISVTDVALRIRAAACLLPPDGAVTGWAAAWMLGARVLDGRTPWGELLPVRLAIPPHRRIRRRDGITVNRSPLPSNDVVRVNGVPVTSALRTAFELARADGPHVRAVAGVDAMLNVHLVKRADLGTYVEAHARWDGVPRARRVVADADEGAQNPMETDLRLLWQQVTGRRPLANRYIFNRSGVFVARSDILDEQIATVGEFDGDEHASRRARTRDARRRRRMEHVGLTVVTATSIDLLRDRTLLEAEIRRTEVEQLARDRSRDRWQLRREPVP